MYCEFTWDTWVATWGAGHPRHAKPAVSGLAHRYNSPLRQVPKQKSLQHSISSYQFLVGRNNHQTPLCYTVPLPFHTEDEELRPFGVWPFSCWLFDVIHGAPHTFPNQRDHLFSWGSCWVELFSWILSLTYPWAQDWKWWEVCDAFDGFFGNFPSPWVVWIKLSNGLQLTEGKSLEDFWVDTFPIIFLPSCAAKLGYISLREHTTWGQGKSAFL